MIAISIPKFSAGPTRMKHDDTHKEKMRADFENWISSPPYEKDIRRFPNDEKHFAWPRQYRDIVVQLAWEAWQESGKSK